MIWAAEYSVEAEDGPFACPSHQGGSADAIHGGGGAVHHCLTLTLHYMEHRDAAVRSRQLSNSIQLQFNWTHTQPPTIHSFLFAVQRQ